MGDKHHMLAGDPTHLYRLAYLVRPWMRRQDIACLHRRHGAFKRSYAGVEGGFIRQDNGMTRATCSCGTPPQSGRWFPFCVCVGVWTHNSHDPGGTMGGSDTNVLGIPESPCAHRRRFLCDTGGYRPAEQHWWQGPRICTVQRGACLARPRRDGAI